MTCLPLRPHVSGRQGFSHRALPMGTQTLTLVRGENGHSCQMEMIGGLMASCSKKSVHVHRRGLEASLPLHVFPSKGLFCTPLTPHSCPVTEAGRAPSHPVVLPSPQTELISCSQQVPHSWMCPVLPAPGSWVVHMIQP